MSQPTYTNVAAPPMPLNLFTVLWLIFALFTFVFAAVGRYSMDLQHRLMSTGLACLTLYFLLQLIGGLVK